MEPNESFDEMKARIIGDVQRLLERLDGFEKEVNRLEESYQEGSGRDEDREDRDDSSLSIPSWVKYPKEDISEEEEFTEEQPSAKVVIDNVYESIADLRERCKHLVYIFEKMNPSTIEERDVRDRISQFEQHALQGFTEIGTIQAELSYTEAELKNFLYQDFRKMRHSGKIGPVRKATKAVVSYIKHQLFPLIKKISTQLYNWIVKFVTPKGWSIGGEIGANLVFQANATLQINFGP